jgi:hypothetical protein
MLPCVNRLHSFLAAMSALIGLAACSGSQPSDQDAPAAAVGGAGGDAIAGDGGTNGATTSGSAGRAGSTGSVGSGEPGTSGTAGSGAGDVNATAGSGGITIVTTTPEQPPTGDECLGTRIDTDRHSASCGACEHACAPITIASQVDWPTAIALDGSTAYWITSGGDGVLMSAPVDGSSPAVVLGSTLGWPMDVAVDATHVYWTSGSVYKMPLAGGDAVRLVPIDVYIYPRELTVDATHVYWTDQGEGEAGTVMKVPLDGGMPVTLAMLPGSSPYGIAVDAGAVYWANGADVEDRLVLKVGLNGGMPTTLATGPGSVFGFAIDATSAYFTTFEVSSTVMRVALDGGAPVMLASGSAQPMGLAIDGARAYWTNASTSQTFNATPGTDGTVLAVPLAGGATSPLAPDQTEPAAIATNGTTVCWTTIGAGLGSGHVSCLGGCDDGVCR